MLNEICAYLHNWFDQGRFFGIITIANGTVLVDGADIMNIAKNGQYIRLIGSALNDGVYKCPDDFTLLTDEVFDGAVWTLAIPRDLVGLASEICAWKSKYEAVDSPSMSPYYSESFGGYTYSKSYSVASAEKAVSGWQSAYAHRLNRYKKVFSYKPGGAK